MTLPKVYRTSSEKIIQSFNFTDVASGTAYKTLYATRTGTPTEILISQPIDADVDYWSTTYNSLPNTGVPAKVGELNFDLTFDNRSQVVEGDLYIQSTLELNSGGGTSNQALFKYRVLHVDTGATETEIAAQVATSQRGVAALTNQSWRMLDVLSVAQTRFKDGEKLRIEIEIWGSRSGTSSGDVVQIWHDPSNRSTGPTNSDATSLIVMIPFKIQR